MIVAEVKPIKEIREMIKGVERILLLGCNTCTAVCFSSGKRELELLQAQLSFSLGNASPLFWQCIVRRACEQEMVEEISAYVREVEAILCLSCGIGVQTVADIFSHKEVFPALNTSFLGRPEKAGFWREVCLACGNCLLHLTGGICPIARCAKSLLNGPCGGSHEGRCEISPDVPCAWEMIFKRLKEKGKLELLKSINNPRSFGKRPSTLLREDVFENEK